MRISDTVTLNASPERVYAAFRDPAVLARTLPGCETLTTTGDDRYDMRITAGVAAIRGTYDGTVALADLQPPSSFTMTAQGAGAPGTMQAEVAVRLEETGGGTRLTYDADAVLGGMVGGVGQRMITGVGKKMAREFFAAVDDDIAGVRPAAAEPVPTAGAAPAVGQVFAGPAAARPAVAGRQDLLTGIAIGAGLVVLGVIVGGVFGRRR